jgi:hypothetical protein
MKTLRRVTALPPALEQRFTELLATPRYREDLLEAVKLLEQRGRVDLVQLHGILKTSKADAKLYSRRLQDVAMFAIPWDTDGKLKTSSGRMVRGRQATRRQLLRALEDARAFYEIFPDSAPRAPIYRAIVELLTLLEAPKSIDNLGDLLGPNVSPARKAKRGPRVREDRPKIRKELLAAGVPADLVNPLLRYVGILPVVRS